MKSILDMSRISFNVYRSNIYPHPPPAKCRALVRSRLLCRDGPGRESHCHSSRLGVVVDKVRPHCDNCQTQPLVSTATTFRVGLERAWTEELGQGVPYQGCR